MTATILPLNTQREPSLDPLMALAAGDMNGVNAVILERMQSKVALIPELAGHLIAGGGKRMRPMLTLSCATLLGYPVTRHHKRVAAVSEEHELAIECYGRKFGIAFQHSEDVIDYASDAATMGKGVGDDFRDGKMTLPVILAYARGSDSDRAFWRAAIGGERVSDDDLVRATHLLQDSGALADTIERARQYARR